MIWYIILYIIIGIAVSALFRMTLWHKVKVFVLLMMVVIWPWVVVGCVVYWLYAAFIYLKDLEL